jgi:hypothetical protein
MSDVLAAINELSAAAAEHPMLAVCCATAAGILTMLRAGRRL